MHARFNDHGRPFLATGTRLCLVVMTLLLAACAGPGAPPDDVPKLTQGEVVKRYNENLKNLDRLWARTVVEVRWLAGGKQKFEQGEGNLLLLLPDRVACSVGKLGNVMLWVGCDAERYWLLDLRESRTAFLGRHDSPNALTPDDLPVTLRPRELLGLLGVLPIAAATPDAPAAWEQGGYVVDLPAKKARVIVDAGRFRARRIELLDPQGKSKITCDLTAYESIELAGKAPAAWPQVATRYAIVAAATADAGEAKMTLFLSGLTDGVEDDRISDRAFEFDHLKRIFKIDRVVDLDEK